MLLLLKTFVAHVLDFCVLGKSKIWCGTRIVSFGNLWKKIVANKPCSLCMVSMMSLTYQISDTCSAQEARAHMVNLDAFCILFSQSKFELKKRRHESRNLDIWQP